jgi:hypothetical protein
VQPRLSSFDAVKLDSLRSSFLERDWFVEFSDTTGAFSIISLLSLNFLSLLSVKLESFLSKRFCMDGYRAVSALFLEIVAISLFVCLFSRFSNRFPEKTLGSFDFVSSFGDFNEIGGSTISQDSVTPLGDFDFRSSPPPRPLVDVEIGFGRFSSSSDFAFACFLV